MLGSAMFYIHSRPNSVSPMDTGVHILLRICSDVDHQRDSKVQLNKLLSYAIECFHQGR